MLDERKDAAKAWFNPLIKGYELYTSDGHLIHFQMGASITIDDNWGESKHKIPVAKVELIVEIVNDQPLPTEK